VNVCYIANQTSKDMGKHFNKAQQILRSSALYTKLQDRVQQEQGYDLENDWERMAERHMRELRGR